MNSSDPSQFLELLKAQIEANLASAGKADHSSGMCKEDAFDLSQFSTRKQFEAEMSSTGLSVDKIFHNSSPAILYEQALKNESGSFISNTGALMVSSGAKTGRCPGDKRVVDHPDLKDIWWGKVNIKLDPTVFLTNRERAVDYLNTRKQLYVVDAYAGWDTKYRIKVRIITSRAYHALFMQNMLVMPPKEEILSFKPDFIIYNAGQFPCNRFSKGMTSSTSVCMDFQRGEMVILGTEYAGEMKKGILTLMMYAMPVQKQLPLHSSATVGKNGDVTLFFGLSGTGKTTLSADPNRFLIGDDEHVWTDDGVFNIEGGCYAKAIGLTEANEPDIYRAIRFGSVLENVVFDSNERDVDYNDTSVTENTRCAYPLHFIKNARIPAVVSTHPSAVVLLCCDAFGVLPPISKLTKAQVKYFFISGYTAKVAGTEIGVTEPTATFSACFGAPFLVWHPSVYADMLADRLDEHDAHAYLLNTGWIGGGYGTGKRCPLKYTRKMVDAINTGALVNTPCRKMNVFNLEVPEKIEGVPDEILMPSEGWKDKEAFEKQVHKLASLFQENFVEYTDKVSDAVIAAGPQI